MFSTGQDNDCFVRATVCVASDYQIWKATASGIMAPQQITILNYKYQSTVM